MNRTDQEREDGVWRDEEKLPLADLARAVATSPADGQTDDQTGNDAGITPTTSDDREPDPTSAAGRALRNDFTGPTGPN